jgi:protein disulfide-isomerase
MFRLLTLAIVLSIAGLSSAWAEASWLSDYHKAQEEAKTSHRLLLINFTGSDWCPWCIRLDREVFSKPEFDEYAKKNLVLLTADFPRSKPLSDETRRQNEELAQRFGIEGFPTIVVLNGEGKPVGMLGYVAGGPSAFIEQLKKIPKS